VDTKRKRPIFIARLISCLSSMAPSPQGCLSKTNKGGGIKGEGDLGKNLFISR
jgi:hypothetical protein